MCGNGRRCKDNNFRVLVGVLWAKILGFLAYFDVVGRYLMLVFLFSFLAQLFSFFLAASRRELSRACRRSPLATAIFFLGAFFFLEIILFLYFN